MPALFSRILVQFPGKVFFFSKKMKIRNFQIENRLSKVKIIIKRMSLFRQLSGVLNPLAYILVVLTLIRIIIASSRILVNIFRVSMLFEKMEHEGKAF